MGGESADERARGEPQPLEAVAADARRRALEAMAPPRHPELKLLVLGPLAIAASDPVGERFSGEADSLARIVGAEAESRDPATRRLSHAVLDVWRGAREGTAASRTALLRAVLAFLLHHTASESAALADTQRIERR